MTEQKIKNISKDIHKTHERIASEYGLDPLNSKSQKKGYNDWNLKYNVIAPLKNIIDKNEKSLILDAGCGNGQISKILFMLGVKKIVGLDFSYQMLQNALKRLDNLDFKHSFFPVQADLNDDLPVKTESFDLVLLFGVIEHLDEPSGIIKKLMICVKPGGVIVIALPRKWSLSHISYVIWGVNPLYWGLRKKGFTAYFNFKEKIKYYKFYSPEILTNQIKKYPDFYIEERIGFAYFHLDGIPGKILHYLGNKGNSGYRILRVLNKIARFCRLVPGGEYWVIRRQSN